MMLSMQHDLAGFLSNRTPAAEEQATWGDLALRIACYIRSELPPLEYVTSARALVFRGNEILVVTNPHEVHVYPGGRLEAGETPEQALHREVLEETGWVVARPLMLGLIHFHILSARPIDYQYPYPDFIQVVYRVEAAEYRAGARVAGDYEQQAVFLPIREALELKLTMCQHVFLKRLLSTFEPG